MIKWYVFMLIVFGWKKNFVWFVLGKFVEYMWYSFVKVICDLNFVCIECLNLLFIYVYGLFYEKFRVFL